MMVFIDRWSLFGGGDTSDLTVFDVIYEGALPYSLNPKNNIRDNT